MIERERSLRTVDVGDIFHAGYSEEGAASLICIATAISETTIRATRMTTHCDLLFDRRSGVEISGAKNLAIIDSIEPLPELTRQVFIGIMEKFRPKDDFDEEKLKLTEAEKQALLFIGTHYRSNPL